MTNCEDNIENLEQQIPEFTKRAVEAAYREALDSGQIVLVSGENGIYRAYANGTRILVKSLAKPLRVAAGTKITIP